MKKYLVVKKRRKKKRKENRVLFIYFIFNADMVFFNAK